MTTQYIAKIEQEDGVTFVGPYPTPDAARLVADEYGSKYPGNGTVWPLYPNPKDAAQ
jgi:hypothetical protein